MPKAKPRKKAGKAANPKPRAEGQTVGRPIKLTPELQDKIVAYLHEGNYVETAASACGIDKKSLYDWLKRGARGERPFAAFLHAVDAAQANAEARDVQRMDAHGRQAWQAVAWRLERRHPDRWGRRDRVEVEASVTQYVVEAPPKLDKDAWAQAFSGK